MKTSESFQFLGGELKETQDETLFLELALRGYDLSRLPDPDENKKPAGEIVKIGELWHLSETGNDWQWYFHRGAERCM